MTGCDLHVRTATVADAVIIAEFNRVMAHETEGITLDPIVLRRGVEAALADPRKARYFLAEIAGRVVGQAMVTVEWSDWRNGFFWWFQSVYVQPESRRCGVFRRLYQHIRDEASERSDVCGLRLYVYRENAGALDTYRRMGMTVCDYLLCEEILDVAEPRP